jgi:hypothetical protein
MKKSLFLAATIATLFAPSFAQQTDDERTPSIPFFNSILGHLKLKNDTQLPPLPQLSETAPPSIELRTFNTYRGTLYQLEIVQQSRAEVLASVTAALGVPCVLDTSLRNNYYKTEVFRALSLEGLLSEVIRSSQVKFQKSFTGAYYFTDQSVPLPQPPRPQLAPLDPNHDPFIFPQKRIQPKSKATEPQEEKAPDPFIIPIPKNAEKQEPFVIPIPKPEKQNEKLKPFITTPTR